jgi:chromosome segregation ATPase
LRYLNQTNELLRNNERRAREKADEIKKDWKNACERLVLSEKMNEQKESEIFRLKKLIEEKDNQLIKIPSLEKGHMSSVDQIRKDYEGQLKELRVLLNNYCLEINELKATVDGKNGEIEEHQIRHNFIQEEFERANREHMRWKERYESF